MNYYLQYRPQTIAELDLAAVRQILTEALGAKSVPHAWLLAGPKGTGKTSSARIIAKAVNCAAKKIEPCNRCPACREITKGTSLDVLEIDAASNRGIDDIRDLKEKIKLAPSILTYKVYIIDEAHMLTKEAFNALLKTLEEPPPHAIFILATTEPDKLPETIVSRCLTVKFTQASPAELTRSLNRVVKAEKIKISADSLAKIAAAADGSFRDGVKILEQLAAGGKQITAAKVNFLLQAGLVQNSLDDWLVMVYRRQTRQALDWLQSAWKEGAQPKQLALAALERLRQVLLNRLGIKSGRDIPALTELATVRQLAGRFLAAAAEIKTAAIEALPLELLVAERNEVGPRPPESKEDPSAAGAGSAADVKRQPVMAKWPEVLEAVKPLNHSLEALLRATEPVGFSKGYLLLKVYYQFHKDRLEEERYRSLIEQTASKILATKVRIKYQLADKAAAAELIPEADKDIIQTAEEIFGTEGGD